jgi:hypothetical protein
MKHEYIFYTDDYLQNIIYEQLLDINSKIMAPNEQLGLMSCKVMWIGENPTLHRSISAPSSELKSKSNKKPAEADGKLSLAYSSSETSGPTQHYKSEDCTLHSHGCENLKSNTESCLLFTATKQLKLFQPVVKCNMKLTLK